MVILMEMKGIPILLLSGRFAAHEVPGVRDALASLIDSPEPVLIIDMSGVSFVDSTALALLLAARKACLASGGDLALCGLSPAVRGIFDLTRLMPMFAHYKHLPEAVSAMWPTHGRAM